MLYFAYGSNLLEERLKLHVPAARLAGLGSLRGWRRKFQLRSRDGSAKCDIVREADSILHGALFEIDPAGRRVLDEWEGLGFMYHEETSTITTDRGSIEAFFYAGNESHIDPHLRPYDWYLASLLAGGRRLGLPADELKTLESYPTWPDPDPDRAARNWSLIPAGLRDWIAT